MKTEAFSSDFYICNEKSYPNKKAYRKIESKEGVVKKCEQSICSATDNQQKCCNAKVVTTILTKTWEVVKSGAQS